MKSEFIAIAAHELRTPLATIQGYAELMYNRELSIRITPEQQHEYLGYILDRSTALEQITNDLLDVGRAETGRKLILERTPCEMITLVHEIVNHHRRESPIHSFVVDCPEACLKLNVDRNKIHRVFDNLLSNAVKYSPKGGTIRIKGEMNSQKLVVTIKDEGVGMTPEQINQAFNKFYRADTSNTAVRGLGLGLTICKTIIEAHGGIIWIDSHPGEGTAFHFSLPIDRPDN
jgi:signal transduction histidine kinase